MNSLYAMTLLMAVSTATANSGWGQQPAQVLTYQPTNSYQQPQQSSYSAPAKQQSYSAPQQSYAQPLTQSYAPQQQSYSAPASSSYSAPATSSYSAPATSSYSAPATSSYSAPATSSYSAPATSSYSAPASSGWSQPELVKVAFSSPSYGSSNYGSSSPSYGSSGYGSSYESNAAILRHNQNIRPGWSHEFDYATSNGISHSETTSVKQVSSPSYNSGYSSSSNGYSGGYDGGNTAVVKYGRYSYTSPEGQPISLSYNADENGFHPQGAHLPVPPKDPNHDYLSNGYSSGSNYAAQPSYAASTSSY